MINVDWGRLLQKPGTLSTHVHFRVYKGSWRPYLVSQHLIYWYMYLICINNDIKCDIIANNSYAKIGYHLQMMFISLLDDQGRLANTLAKSWYTFDTCSFSRCTFAGCHDLDILLHNTYYIAICVRRHQQCHITWYYSDKKLRKNRVPIKNDVSVIAGWSMSTREYFCKNLVHVRQMFIFRVYFRRGHGVDILLHNSCYIAVCAHMHF